MWSEPFHSKSSSSRFLEVWWSSDLNFCTGPFHFILWLCHLLKLDWLPGTWEGTNYRTCMKELKGREGKKLRCSGAPTHRPTDVELGTLRATAATFLFSSLWWISSRLLPTERGRDRLETENGLKSFKNSWTLREKKQLGKLKLLQRTLICIGTSFLSDFSFEKNWDRRSSVTILGFLFWFVFGFVFLIY